VTVLKAGHEFRDEDGTVIAKLTRDINTHEHVMASDFILPDGTQPVANELIPPALARALNL
jgi:hypothetical protein